MAPTVMREGPYRFFFYSNDAGEPAHVHVQEGRKLAKFWLTPVALASSRNFAAHELNALLRLARKHRDDFQEAWHEHFCGDD